MNNFGNIPKELTELNNWVVWGVPNYSPKCPCNPKDLKPAKINLPETWGNFDVAVERVNSGKATGIGFVFDGSGYIGCDLDNVRSPETGEIVPYAQEIIEQCATYTEISPSGYGVHIIAKNDFELKHNRKKLPPNDVVRFDKNDKEAEPGIEMYKTSRYFIMTGNIVGNSSTIADSAGIKVVYEQYLQSTVIAVVDTQDSNSSNKDYLAIGLKKDKNNVHTTTLPLLYCGQPSCRFAEKS